MKKYHFVGFLLLLVSTISMLPASAYASEANDNDGDGVPNIADRCPHLLEDYDPEFGINVDGCPADFVPWYDADYDGIQDHIDDCPSVKENYNKFQDEDGCPDLSPNDGKNTADSDNDGFADFLDLCPNQPETFNGIDDKDGCPDDAFSLRDTDQDGLSDNLDNCPNVKETYNQFQDTDGCPDIVSESGQEYTFSRH